MKKLTEGTLDLTHAPNGAIRPGIVHGVATALAGAPSTCGALIIKTTTTLTRNLYCEALHIEEGATLHRGGYYVFVRSPLDDNTLSRIVD